MADPQIRLSAQLPNNMQPDLGDLILGDPMPHNQAILFYGKFTPQPHSSVVDRFLGLQLRISADANSPSAWGSVVTDLKEVVQLSGNPYNRVTFTWRPTHSDLEAIERYRAGGRRLTLHLSVDGLAYVTRGDESVSELHPVRGEGQLTLTVTDWEDKVLTPLDYKLPPSWDRLLPNPDAQSRLEWTATEKNLDQARKLLRHGSARDALGATLDAFESILSKPYDQAQWEAKLKVIPEEELPAQKREGIARMLAGFCTYLNKVGHHRASQSPSVATSLPAMPVDQWEAEQAIAAAHFLLATALRLIATIPAAVPTTIAAPSTAAP